VLYPLSYEGGDVWPKCWKSTQSGAISAPWGPNIHRVPPPKWGTAHSLAGASSAPGRHTAPSSDWRPTEAVLGRWVAGARGRAVRLSRPLGDPESHGVLGPDVADVDQ
jgi:hypothetical protein